MARRSKAKVAPMLSPLTPDEWLARWQEWTEDLFSETQILMEMDLVFWGLKATIDMNGHKSQARLFLSILTEQYERSMLVGIRALTDRSGGEQQSAIKLLLEMIEHAGIAITRERFARFFGDDANGQYHAEYGFDRLAGTGNTVIPRYVFQEKISDLERAASTCREYATAHIVHRLSHRNSKQKPSPEDWRSVLIKVWDCIRWIKFLLNGTFVQRVPFWAVSPFGFIDKPLLESGQQMPDYQSAFSLAPQDPLVEPSAKLNIVGTDGTCQ